MALERKTGLSGWTGNAGVYYQTERPARPNGKELDDKLRLEAMLNSDAQATHLSTTNPTANHDSAGTATLVPPRPFRIGCLWWNSTDNNLLICTGHDAGAATWRDIGGIAANNSSSSSSSSSESSSSSSDSSSSSSTIALNTSSSSQSSSSDSTMSSSSSSSSSDSSSSSSTVDGNTSSSSNSSSSSSSSSSTQALNTSSSSSSP